MRLNAIGAVVLACGGLGQRSHGEACNHAGGRDVMISVVPRALSSESRPMDERTGC